VGAGHPERLPALARELVALKVDVIVTAGTVPIRAAKDATETIPIVFVVLVDPVATGSSPALRARAATRRDGPLSSKSSPPSSLS